MTLEQKNEMLLPRYERILFLENQIANTTKLYHAAYEYFNENKTLANMRAINKLDSEIRDLEYKYESYVTETNNLIYGESL